jgi:MFS family permease
MPALSVRRAELRKSLRLVTAAWMFGIVWMVGISGTQVKSFCRMLGFNDFTFGVMNAIPWLASSAQIAATIMIERTGRTKFHFINTMLVSRAVWVLLPLIPLLLPIPSPAAVVTMMLILMATNLMAHMGTPAWWTWMGDLIPRRIRGRYMARRSRLCNPIQIVTVLVLGYIIDRVTVPDAAESFQAQALLMKTAMIVFLVAGVFGVLDVLTFYRIREIRPPVRHRRRRPAVDIRVARPRTGGLPGLAVYAFRYLAAAFKQVLIEPLSDLTFRRYVGYGLVLTFAMTVGGWFYTLLAMEHLGLSNLATMTLFLAVGPIAGILSSSLWGRLIDRWGRRPVLLIATAGTAVSSVIWLWVRPDLPCPALVSSAVNWVTVHAGGLVGRPFELIGPATPAGPFLAIMVACTFGGSCWLGVNLAQTGILLGFADGPGRSKYVASSAVLISVGGVLSGIMGGLVTWLLHDETMTPWGPFAWVNWHATIGMALIAQIAALVLAGIMPDPGSRSVRDVLRFFGVNAYNAVMPRLFLRVRLLGWRRRGGDGQPPAAGEN